MIFRVTVTVTGDGNSRTVSRFVPALFVPTSYPRRRNTTPHMAAWRKCEHKCGVYLKLRRTTEQSVSNALDMLLALFVFCSFLFGNVRSVFVLKISLKACKSAEPVALDRFVSPPERFIDVLLLYSRNLFTLYS